MSDGRVTFDVVADNSTVPGTIRDTTNKLTAAATEWQSQMDKAGKTGLSFNSIIQGVGQSLGQTLTGALKNAGKAALDFVKSSIDAASDLAEVQNVVDVTFEESAGKIDAWAKKAASAYGLTELQAKRYTSTLGAMMKSSGLAADSITGMATELAGLAADMASFYNLDFDTAFDKIRSGISGETEPLKQLGVNMSVANLNAFALSQGIQKTFEKMSQSEQVLLRYQYLMQATADAQGDFARTADGYANSQRRIETAWESIKTSVGTLVLGPLGDATTALATFMEGITAKPPKTVLEQIADIDVDTSKQIAEIEKTAGKARALVGTLQGIQTESSALETVKGNVKGLLDDLTTGIGDASKAAKADEGATAGYLNNLKGAIEDLQGADAEATLPGYLSDLGQTLVSVKITGSTSRNWTNLLGQLINHVGPLSKAIGEDQNATITWLRSMQETVDSLDDNAAEQWTSLFSTLEEKIPGLRAMLEENGFIQGLNVLQGAGDNITSAEQAVAGVSDNAEEAAVKQKQWLDVCRELVAEIPGLSTIIDTETGAIKGGLDAVRAYITEWESGQKRLAYVKAQARKQEALDAAFDELVTLEVDVILDDQNLAAARQKLADTRKDLEDLNVQFDENGKPLTWARPLSQAARDLADTYNALSTQVDAAVVKNEKLHESYDTMRGDYEKAQAALEQENETLGINKEKTDGAKTAVEGYAGTLEQATSTVEHMQKALTSLADYEGKALDKTTDTIEKTVDGFEKLETKTKLTTEQIKANLASQTKWMTDYLTGLQELKDKGVGAELLGFLSDGSKESAEAVFALRGASGEEIKAISEQYKAIEQQKKEMAKELTGNQLAGDEAYQKLVKDWESAVGELDLSKEAGAAAANTVQAMIDSINGKYESLSVAITSIKTLMSELQSMGLGGIPFVDGSFAEGLDYVPYDGFVAELHQGEAILTAEEAAQFRNWGLGREAASGVDYDALSAAISGSVPDGSASVYMDGEIVGRMVSRSQGNTYRQLERSGWR